MLVKNILKSRFPQECKAWEHQQAVIQNDEKEAHKAKITEMTTRMEAELPRTQDTLALVISEHIIELFP